MYRGSWDRYRVNDDDFAAVGKAMKLVSAIALREHWEDYKFVNLLERKGREPAWLMILAGHKTDVNKALRVHGLRLVWVQHSDGLEYRVSPLEREP